MTIKRLILGILTVMAVAFLSLSLFSSWHQPQIQSRLELYQTNLVLDAAEWQDPNLKKTDANLTVAEKTLFGEDAYKTAIEQYQAVRQSAETNLTKAAIAQPQKDPEKDALEIQQLQSIIHQQQQLINELDLRLGILQIQDGKPDAAFKTWQDLIQRSEGAKKSEPIPTAANALIGIWSNPAKLLPDAESLVQQHLDGWFRYRALMQIYQLQQRPENLLKLQTTEQVIAKQAVVKLTIISGIPIIGCVIGIGLLVFLAIQWFIQRQQSLLMQNTAMTWEIPWNGETIVQVFVVGFFFVGQILIPLALDLGKQIIEQVTHLSIANFDVRGQAFYVLASYGFLAGGGLSVLYFSVKPFLPLPKDWFHLDWRGNWLAWGIGGYFVALPLVILVSLINQKLWQGQGGSNPILPIALEGRDPVALTIFFITASVAAPLFEEVMFRGFLLPSLTRYLPMGGAILTSSLLFAVAHQNLSEILPLVVLGMVLGFVYSRSRNLLAPMLLHSLWNSGTLLSLFILGSGAG